MMQCLHCAPSAAEAEKELCLGVRTADEEARSTWPIRLHRSALLIAEHVPHHAGAPKPLAENTRVCASPRPSSPFGIPLGARWFPMLNSRSSLQLVLFVSPVDVRSGSVKQQLLSSSRMLDGKRVKPRCIDFRCLTKSVFRML